MSRGVQSFRQSDVRRALRATKAAGLDVARVKIGRDGNFEIEIGKQGTEAASDCSANPWDDAA